MKKKFFYVITIIFLFTIGIVFKSLVIDRPEDIGRIRVISSPTAGVFINDLPLGNTPVETKYKPGEYRLKLIPEGGSEKAVSWEGKIQILPHALTYVIRDLGESEVTSGGEILTVVKIDGLKAGPYGAIKAKSTPEGAIISLDSDEKGATPIDLLDIPAGEYELSIAMPGFIKRTQKILITPNHAVNVDFKLALDPKYKTLNQLIEEESKQASLEAQLSVSPSPINNISSDKKLVIKKTESGFLNVREEPNIASGQINQVMPGEVYSYKEVKNNWYLIELSNDSKGWVLGDYVELK